MPGEIAIPALATLAAFAAGVGLYRLSQHFRARGED